MRVAHELKPPVMFLFPYNTHPHHQAPAPPAGPPGLGLPHLPKPEVLLWQPALRTGQLVANLHFFIFLFFFFSFQFVLLFCLISSFSLIPFFLSPFLSYPLSLYPPLQHLSGTFDITSTTLACGRTPPTVVSTDGAGTLAACTVQGKVAMADSWTLGN